MSALYFYIPAVAVAIALFVWNLFDTAFFSEDEIGKQFKLIKINEETIVAEFMEIPKDSAKPRKLLRRFVPNIEELTLEHTYEVLPDLSLQPVLLNDPHLAGHFLFSDVCL